MSDKSKKMNNLFAKGWTTSVNSSDGSTSLVKDGQAKIINKNGKDLDDLKKNLKSALRYLPNQKA